MFETVIKSDLTKPVQVKQLSGNFFSGDNAANTITVEVCNNGVPVALSGGVQGKIIREDNETLTVGGSLSGSPVANKASITLPATAYNVVGKISIVVKVGNKTVGACTGYVYRTTTDSLVDPDEGSVELIDDTAGSGVTNKVWSAGKTSDELAKKADKVASPTSGNFAGLDSNGNLTDSGKKASDFLATSVIDDTAGNGDTDKVWSADKVYDELYLKAPKADPEFTGSISLGRITNTTVGNNSSAIGISVTASGNYSDAEGYSTTATGSASHAEGYDTLASASASHAEGGNTQATANYSHAEGMGTIASALYSHAEGNETQASKQSQHVSGKYNVVDTTENGYAEIVGNGTSVARSNARTLDWDGNERLNGDVYVGCNTDSTGGKALGAGKADVIEDSITTPASVQTFTDGADNLPMKVVFGIEPVQDLHGYDAPNPPGAKNLFNKDNIMSGYRLKSSDGGGNEDANYFISPYIPVTVGTTYTKNSPTADAYHRYWTYSNDNVGSGVRKLDNNNTITIESGEKYIRFCGLLTELDTTQFEVGSSSTTYQPYSNICPITGFTGAELTRTGKNLFDGEFIDNAMVNTPAINNSVPGVASNSYHKVSKKLIPVKPNTSYTLSGTDIHKRYTGTTAAGLRFGYYDSDKKPLSEESADLSSDPYTKTTPANAAYVRFQVGGSATNVQFEEESYATKYDGNGETYHIDFPSEAGTVYGGTLTVNKDGSGNLLVNKATYTANEQNTTMRTGGFRFYSNPTALGDTNDNLAIISDRIPTATQTQYADPANTQELFCYIHKTSGGINWNTNKIYESVSAMITDIGEIAFCYKLDTPVTYQLSAEQVKTLLGVNNVWVDTGDIQSIVYPADTKLYIDKKFAELSAAITALGT